MRFKITVYGIAKEPRHSVAYAALFSRRDGEDFFIQRVVDSYVSDFRGHDYHLL